MTSYPHLFREGRIGRLSTPNRIVMCPMTRFRVTSHGVPMPANVTYYAQRASAGLIVTEANQVSAMGRGLPRSAGLYTRDQIEGWRAVVDEVHAQGGRIFAQLTHCGRLSHPSLLPDNATPLAPSSVLGPKQRRVAEDEVAGPTYVDSVAPRALSVSEIPSVIAEYKHAARCAFEAGFDGVELHSASGNLSHQFLASCANRRTDHYGGSAANRCRFTIELMRELADVKGSYHVGIKVAPTSSYNEIAADKLEILETYSRLMHELSLLDIAYVHVQRPPADYLLSAADFDVLDFLREHYRGTLIAAGEFDRRSGEAALANNRADFIAYGRRYISNPDLVRRIRLDAEENAWNEATLYAATAEGFIDYPTLP